VSDGVTGCFVPFILFNFLSYILIYVFCSVILLSIPLFSFRLFFSREFLFILSVYHFLSQNFIIFLILCQFLHFLSVSFPRLNMTLRWADVAQYVYNRTTEYMTAEFGFYFPVRKDCSLYYCPWGSPSLLGSGYRIFPAEVRRPGPWSSPFVCIECRDIGWVSTVYTRLYAVVCPCNTAFLNKPLCLVTSALSHKICISNLFFLLIPSLKWHHQRNL
jgi:hypothetical protein